MKTIRPIYREWQPENKNQPAGPYSGKGTILEPDTLIEDADGEPIGFTIDMSNKINLAWLTARMHKIKWNNGKRQRMSGITNVSRTFGFSPPVPLRRRYGATLSTFDLENKQESKVLRHLANVCWDAIEELLPSVAQTHLQKMEGVHKDWWYGGSPFTAGIINNSAALPYHIDRGNIDGTWAALICLRKHMDGGMLHVPELDAYFSLPHMSIAIFNNQKLWHGVTPFEGRNKFSERYSIVYYSKREMLDAAPLEQEAGRAAKRRTKHESEHA